MTISELLDKYEPKLARAFQQAIDEITSKAQIQRIREALERGNIDEAIEVISVDAAAFREFERVLEDSFIEGGDSTINGLSIRDAEGRRFVIRFNARNLRAEQILREDSSQLVTRIVEEQRNNIRDSLQQGLARGDNPRTTALDVVGRIDKRTGRRTGGIVGLSGPQVKAVERARLELLEGDYSAYLQRQKRDKRFDAAIRAAIRDGKPLTADQIRKITGRYSDRLLKLRGDTIARTETLASLHKGQFEAIQQLVDSGKVQANQVSLTWDAARDGRTRAAHRVVAAGPPIKFGEMFTVGGRQMKYPGDPAGGPEQVINCRCALRPKINYFVNLR